MSIFQKTLITASFVLAGLLLAIGVTSLAVGAIWAGILWIGLIVLVLVLAAVLPVSTRGLDAQPRPTRTYPEALARFAEATAKPEAPINPLCEPQLFVHGHMSEKVYVLLHGLSNCPQTFIELGPMLHGRGANVLIPRMPRNGHKDIATDALRKMTAVELARFADTSVDIACGLGREIIVLGISAGGVIAGWIAQNRPEVSRAVLVAPAYGLAAFGVRLNAFIMRLTLLLPHISVWKDPIRRASGPSRPHSYKRQSTRGTGELLRLGLGTRQQAKKTKPAAGSIVVVTNADDDSVDPTVTDETARLWEADGARVLRFEFGKDLHLPHEMIDPTEPGAMGAVVYPKLIELSEGPLATAVRSPASA